MNAFSYWRGPCLKQVRDTNPAFQRSVLSIMQNWNEHGKEFRMGANLLASTQLYVCCGWHSGTRSAKFSYTLLLIISYMVIVICQLVLMGKNRVKCLRKMLIYLKVLGFFLLFMYCHFRCQWLSWENTENCWKLLRILVFRANISFYLSPQAHEKETVY